MSFSIANNKVDSRNVNAELVRKWADSAKRIEVDGNASKDSWEKLAQGAEKSGSLSQGDLDQITNLGKACFKYHKQLHSDFKASGYKDMAIKDKLSDVHVFTTGSDAVKKAIARSQALAAVEAAAPASFGPTGVVAAYAAAARLDDESLKALVDSVAGMRAGDSPLVFAGNKIQGFHVEEIWPQMMRMLDKAAENGRAGKPQEVNAQYYELTNQQVVGKLAAAAEAGNKVRVNVDAGRLVAYKGSHVVIDEVPDKLRAILQLNTTKGDIAVSAYPVPKELGDPGNLMHRKGLRVGDEFLLSGMNANEGSGENVDAGYVIEGPAARKLVQNFSRDVQNSKDASLEDLYGDKGINGLLERDVRMGRRGLVGLADALDGPAPAGTEPDRPQTYGQLQGYFKERGFDLDKFIDLPADEKGPHLDNAIAENRALPLSDYGKRRLNDLIKLVHKEVHSPENQKRLNDIQAPSDAAKGTSVVSLADTPTEREQLLLQSINEADKFIYVPAFVITRPVAAALAAKAKDMESAGKKIDIKVLADPGIYPDGGTPNSWGVKFLEDNNIPVRWAALPRTGQHDRKVHAKELLTDKSDFVGSTNFSNKGLRENHEHSGAIQFNPDDPLSVRQQQQAKASFEELWDNFSVESNSLATAQQWKKNYQGADKEYQVEDARGSSIRKTIRGIDTYEKESGKWIGSQIEELKLDGKVKELMGQGYDDGNAKLKALREAMGPDEFLQGLHNLPSYQAIH